MFLTGHTLLDKQKKLGDSQKTLGDCPICRAWLDKQNQAYHEHGMLDISEILRN